MPSHPGPNPHLLHSLSVIRHGEKVAQSWKVTHCMNHVFSHNPKLFWWFNMSTPALLGSFTNPLPENPSLYGRWGQNPPIHLFTPKPIVYLILCMLFVGFEGLGWLYILQGMLKNLNYNWGWPIGVLFWNILVLQLPWELSVQSIDTRLCKIPVPTAIPIPGPS